MGSYHENISLTRKSRLRAGIAATPLLMLVLLIAEGASASGYDAPVLYNARHAGMGGTGISYVEGGTSLYLNPAGLGNIRVANIDVAQTLLIATLQGTPTFLAPDVNVKSQGLPAVVPLVGGGYRLNDYLVIGLGAFPSAGADATYVYVWPSVENPVNDKTQVMFIETTVGLAVNIDKIGLRIGVGYRMTYMRLTRQRDDPITNLNIRADGWDFRGFRAGFQWKVGKHFVFGGVYRSKISSTISQNGGQALNMDFEYLALPFTLPARTGGGFRFDVGDFGFSAEFEWLFNSQNEDVIIETRPSTPLPLRNTFDWSDQYMLKFGAEYRFFADRWPWRVGFAYESGSSSSNYPNAFGPPPTAIPTVTVGTGYNHGAWQMNVAYSHGWASTDIEPDTSDFLMTCPNCGGPGDYALDANQLFFDFSYNWR